jgi:UPF0271 protein
MNAAPGPVREIDLNADLGEGFGRWSLADDDAILALVSSANVACGFHAGDPTIMRRMCETAAGRGVAVGAHVAYRDLAGFGRRFVDVSPDALRDDVVYQIAALQGVAAAAGTEVTYVKPHGALYNAIVRHRAQAQAVVDAVRTVDPALAVLGLPGSAVLELAAEAGLRTVVEAFADRAYRADGTLVPRSEPGAVLSDVDEVARRVVRLVVEGVVEAVVAAPGGSGSSGETGETGETTADRRVDVEVAARSLCVHSDTPGAVEVLSATRHALEAAGVAVRSFAPPRAGTGSRRAHG